MPTQLTVAQSGRRGAKTLRRIPESIGSCWAIFARSTGFCRTRDFAKETSHALIGKYVYLHYLRDRGILSPKKLGRWNIEPSSVFGRNATLDGVRAVIERLDEWLNGSVFPLDFSGKHAPEQDHLRYVAGVFAGDEVTEAGDRQTQSRLPGVQLLIHSHRDIVGRLRAVPARSGGSR